jgi:hypothetical protein
MTRYQQTGLDQKNGSLVEGHVWGNWDNQGQAGTHPILETFDVPGDKRLFQLDVKELQARSLYGRALSFAVKSVKDYFLHDETGRVYPVVGQYVIADVDGIEVVEIQYYPEQVQIMNRGGIRDFKQVKKRHLEGKDYRLAYLFLVEPGAKLTKFTTGQGRRPTDLQRDNLVAPD